MARNRSILLVSIAASTLPACLLPPSSIGLRNAGDVAAEGTLTAGGGAALVTNGLSGGAADMEWSVTDQVAVGGGLGWISQGQVQAEARWANASDGGAGWGALGGVGVLLGSGAVGPYAGVTARTPLAAGPLLYGGLKVNYVRTLNPTLVTLPTTWAQPTIGVCSPPGRIRYGIEAVAPITLETGQATGGVQGYVDVVLRP